MNRREQIEKAAKCQAMSTLAPDHECDIVYAQFMAGAYWADKFPKTFRFFRIINSVIEVDVEALHEKLELLEGQLSVAVEALEKINGPYEIEWAESTAQNLERGYALDLEIGVCGE